MPSCLSFPLCPTRLLGSLRSPRGCLVVSTMRFGQTRFKSWFYCKLPLGLGPQPQCWLPRLWNEVSICTYLKGIVRIPGICGYLADTGHSLPLLMSEGQKGCWGLKQVTLTPFCR